VSLQAQPASIEGVIIDALTRQPLGGVHLTAAELPTALPTYVVYGAISGPDGHFSIASLPPTTYVLNPQKTGYVFTPDKDTPRGTILLRPGEHRTAVVLWLTPRAVIKGRVTNEFGDPLPHITVTAVNATRTDLPHEVETDDRGEYRLSGPPGKYVITAEPLPATIYGKARFPDVVEALPGRDIDAVDIRLTPQRLGSVSGIVTGAPAGRNGLVRIWNPHLATQSDQIRNMRAAFFQPGGRFSLPRLPVGDYLLRAEFGDVLQSAAVEVSVQDGETTGIQLALAPGEDLTGVVEIPGPHTAEKRTLTLLPVSLVLMGIGQSISTAVESDGTFRLPSVFPGKYNIEISPIPENAFIMSDTTLDLARGAYPSKLKIALSLNGAKLSGEVVPPLRVCIATTPGDARCSTDGGASYQLTGIRPGKFRFFAVDAVELNDPERMKSLFEKGEPIEIHEGERIDKDAKLVQP
jgi:hypothetical protein